MRASYGVSVSGLRLISPFFKKYLATILAGFLALVVCDLAQLSIPGILGQCIDILSESAAVLDDLRNPVMRIVILAIIVAIMRYGWRNLIIGFSRRVERDLRHNLYEKLIYLPPHWHLKNTQGDLMAMATNDLESIRMAISTGLVSLVDTIILGGVAIMFMASISPTMTLWALLPLPVITIMTHLLGRRIYNLVLKVQDTFGQLTETVQEKLSGLRVIRAMGLIDLALTEVHKAGQLYLKKNIQQATLAGTFFPFIYFLSNISIALALYFGGQETITGQITIGDFVAFINYLAMLTWPLIALGMIIGLVQQGLASLTRLNRVFTALGDGRPEGLTPPVHQEPTITLHSLSFKYPTRTIPALNNLTLELNLNQITAIIGPMGGGKSTLASLLPALYQAPEGALKVGGEWVEKWPLKDLRALFGYIPQDAFLFNGTIYENLSFGRPTATEDMVWEAAKTAGLQDDLAFFPDGLNTVIGEHGLTLSGGQKQRLALARALVTDPPYLILDDTLSAVDAAVESQIMNNLLTLRQGRGMMIISHRLSSLTGVDRVVVIDQGQIIQEGTPGELLRQEGYFKRIIDLNSFYLATATAPGQRS